MAKRSHIARRSVTAATGAKGDRRSGEVPAAEYENRIPAVPLDTFTTHCSCASIKQEAHNGDIVGAPVRHQRALLFQRASTHVLCLHEIAKIAASGATFNLTLTHSLTRELLTTWDWIRSLTTHRNLARARLGYVPLACVSVPPTRPSHLHIRVQTLSLGRRRTSLPQRRYSSRLPKPRPCKAESGSFQMHKSAAALALYGGGYLEPRRPRLT